jgi:putative ABC transport system permease protein
MLDFDKWNELFSTLKKNKLRTALTGFSVAWGIFILIVLLSSGNGLNNAMLKQWSTAGNSVHISQGQTTIPYKGTKTGKYIRLKDNDIKLVEGTRKTETVSALNWLNNQMVSFDKNYVSLNLRGILPDYRKINKYEMSEGRDINQLDINEFRKVIIITQKTKEALFGSKPAIGQYLKISGFMFKVIGIYKFDNDYSNSRTEACLPFSTARKVFNHGNDVHYITATFDANTVDESKAYVENLRAGFAKLHNFDPNDKSALSIYNTYEDYIRNKNLMSAIAGFIWIIGIGTLIAGMVGISNIMIISVKERTREIGIRKAIGARPRSIIGMIMAESIFITSLAGYIGLVFGVLLMEAINKFMPPNDFMINPSVKVGVALIAVAVLIVSGSLAGFIPARKAAIIKPVEAMRADN